MNFFYFGTKKDLNQTVNYNCKFLKIWYTCNSEGCTDQIHVWHCYNVQPVRGDHGCVHDSPTVDHKLCNWTDALEQTGTVRHNDISRSTLLVKTLVEPVDGPTLCIYGGKVWAGDADDKIFSVVQVTCSYPSASIFYRP